MLVTGNCARFELSDSKHHSFRMIFFRRRSWWTEGGSNSRPLHCERSALPAELSALAHECSIGRGPSLPAGLSRFHVRPSREIPYVLFGRILRTRVQQPPPGTRARGHLQALGRRGQTIPGCSSERSGNAPPLRLCEVGRINAGLFQLRGPRRAALRLHSRRILALARQA